MVGVRVLDIVYVIQSNRVLDGQWHDIEKGFAKHTTHGQFNQGSV
jgi:hypothetical protein